MFKGPNEDIESVFTAPVSAVCGVTLDAGGKKEYLISGVYYHYFLFSRGIKMHHNVMFISRYTEMEKNLCCLSVTTATPPCWAFFLER